MASSILRGRSVTQYDVPSMSGRSESVRRAVGRGSQLRLSGTLSVTGDIIPRVSSSPSMCTAISRAPAGPSTILCSSLRKERKKLAKVLKSHRKLLERKLSALTLTDAESPVLSELLVELRTLRSTLEGQRTGSLLYADDSESSDSDDECTTRNLAALSCTRRTEAAVRRGAPPSESPGPATPRTPPTLNAPGGPSAGSSMVISGLGGAVEVAVPEPQEGWEWDEEAFRAALFEGAGGRVMVCTGSKCQRKGGTKVLHAVSALSAGNPAIEVLPCKCVGKCSQGAALRVRQPGQPCATYTEVRPGQLPAMFQEHFGAAPDSPEPGAEAAREAAVVRCNLETGPGQLEEAAGVGAGVGASAVTCCTECMQH